MINVESQAGIGTTFIVKLPVEITERGIEKEIVTNS